jgi:hypothetical protein
MIATNKPIQALMHYQNNGGITKTKKRKRTEPPPHTNTQSLLNKDHSLNIVEKSQSQTNTIKP